MARVIPIAVVIPTYRRGRKVLDTLKQIYRCDPQRIEIWIHVDESDGKLEGKMISNFPSVRVISSPQRIGPGGGRHRCLELCKSPIAVSFDDDSYPLDLDFFLRVNELFSSAPDVAVIGARIWHRHQKPEPCADKLAQKVCFTGCGHAVRLNAYRMTRGYLPLPVSYAMEEVDISLQLLSRGWKILESSGLRVYHDTELSHHQSAETTAGFISNVGLFAFLNYPARFWGRGFLQLCNIIWFSLRLGRIKGIIPGLFRIPLVCFKYRNYREPLSANIVEHFLRGRRRDNLKSKAAL
jgi:GT2 family glycosyltransferase